MSGAEALLESATKESIRIHGVSNISGPVKELLHPTVALTSYIVVSSVNGVVTMTTAIK